jgi:hypothetical protein
MAKDHVCVVERRLIGGEDENCAPALSGFPGTSTAATDPRVIFAARRSAFTAFRPPVPYCVRFAGSFDSGSPP